MTCGNMTGRGEGFFAILYEMKTIEGRRRKSNEERRRRIALHHHFLLLHLSLRSLKCAASIAVLE